MPSPFPGMNPFLEQDEVWHDFHERFIPLAAEILGSQVRPGYIVKLDEHVYIHELPHEQRALLGRADVSVARGSSPQSAATAGAVLEAPAIGRIAAAIDVERHSYIEIRDRARREMVAVIELLSPANKRPGPDREQYLGKRRQLLASPVHLVEIDLLRGHPRLPIDDLPQCDYYALVSRVEDRPQVGLWPNNLRDRLPEIPIPLRRPDPDARLDLQVIVNRIYDAAGYEDYVYDETPQPPLTAEQTAWSESLLGR